MSRGDLIKSCGEPENISTEFGGDEKSEQFNYGDNPRDRVYVKGGKVEYIQW